MRKIDEKMFVSYTISKPGITLTMHNLKAVLMEWKNFGSGSTLYGNKPDGTKAILDTK